VKKQLDLDLDACLFIDMKTNIYRCFFASLNINFLVDSFFCKYEYMRASLHLPNMSGVFVYSLFGQVFKKDTTVPAKVPVTWQS